MEGRAFIYKAASVVYILWDHGYCTRRSIKLDSAVRNMEMASDREKNYTSHIHTLTTYCTGPTSDAHAHSPRTAPGPLVTHTHTHHVLHHAIHTLLLS